MNLPSILIAMPCYGGVMQAKTALSLIEVVKYLEKENISHDILTVSNQSLIPKARSDIANHFINSTTYDYIFWIDADLIFTAEDFFKLYRMAMLGYQHIMGTYRHKTQEVKYSFTVVSDNSGLIWNDDFPQAVKITNNVGGFSMIHRSVFETIANESQHLKYIPWSSSRTVPENELNNSYHYYETPISESNGTILPEDFAFQEKCSKLGIDMWLHTGITLGHNGNTDFYNDDLYSKLKGVVNNDK